MTNKTITHIGVWGNSPFTNVICNRSEIAYSVISVLDLFLDDDLENNLISHRTRFCTLCKDLLLTGNTRGLAKATKIRNLISRIERKMRIANRNSQGPMFKSRTKRACDTAHKLEEELIDVIRNE